MNSPQLSIAPRPYPASTAFALAKEGVPPLLARVLAGRGVTKVADLGYTLGSLLHHSQLLGAADAAGFLADRIQRKTKFVVIADYDCDGATACAVAVRGLRAFGADVQFVVPDRMVHGYGLTPSVVALARERYPQVQALVTVDNGVASHAGVQAAIDLGMEVLVTDHHLPAKNKALPPANVIVDPSQAGCSFASKALAGVGVIWYVLWALQDEFKKRGLTPATPGFKVSELLPLVAVGTIADVVPIDLNNRALVHAGLTRIREGKSYPGIEALAATAFPGQPLRPEKTDLTKLVTSDIAFGIGPRINAAGRLETMDIGIECLTTDDPAKALALAQELAQINQTRKDIEHETAVEAVRQAEALITASEGLDEAQRRTLCVHSPDWHPGVIGIVAGRIKERRYRPTFVLTSDPATGEMKGSGRSIPGFNLKDALDQVDKAHPGLLLKFGGHAMAAGLTLRPGGFEIFRDAFETEAQLSLGAELLNQTVEHDGSLIGAQLAPDTARALRGPTWGQLFPEPAFCDEFRVVEAKVGGVRKDQLAMVVERDGTELKAVKFRYEGAPPAAGSMVRLVYKLQLKHNKYGNEVVSLLLDQVLSALRP